MGYNSQSYRCPPDIINCANRLIRNNSRQIPKEELVSHCPKELPSGEAVRYKVFDSLAQDAEFIGKDIFTRRPVVSDCVLLARTNFLLQNAVKKLQEADYPAFLIQKKSEFETPVLGIIVEALRLANLRHDRIVLKRLCRFWHLLTGDMIDSNAVDAEATLIGGDFLRAWVNVASSVSNGNNECLLNLIRTNLVDRLEFRQMIDSILENGENSLNSQDELELFIKEVGKWQEIHREIIQENGAHITLDKYLQYFDLVSKSLPPEGEAIQCMTVHQSKGLQFNHVYLMGMAQDVFPSYRALRKEEIEEERRNCFVAITRVQRTLTLTRSREYFDFPKKPSQFLEEMKIRADYVT